MSSTSDKNETGEILTSKPFKSLTELYSNLDSLDPWPEVEDLRKNTDYVYSGRNVGNESKPLVKLPRNKKPKTLVCHDMKGGYLEDRFIHGSKAHDSYLFYHWSVLNTFVYFSHYFVTIPPYGWINAAHIHGVKILGTVITEWDDGRRIWNEIFKSEGEVRGFADALIKVAKFYKFDGWLLNVENPVKKEDVKRLKFFIRYLTEGIHDQIEGSEIIWYDSVTRDGELKWQNELNDLNKCFFDICDGIFLNYNWTDSGLAESCKRVIDENRVRDIYVGLDVWGRGCPGGGGFHSDYALRKIRENNMSVAIFGPGWTHEHFGPNTFEDTENLFWAQLVPYLYLHVPLYKNETFRTSFCRGAGLNNYKLGQRQIGSHTSDDNSARDTPFYNLSTQQPQISVPTPNLEFLSKDGTSGTKFETKRGIVNVQGETILFENKTDIFDLNYFKFDRYCSFNGGGCLQLTMNRRQRFQRLFLINATFEHDIQISLVYRVDRRIPNEGEPLIVIGNDTKLKLISKYSTTMLEYPWRRNLYLTNFDTITQFGITILGEQTVTLGEVVVEEKQADYNQIIYCLSNGMWSYVYVMRSASFVCVVKANCFSVVNNLRGGYCLKLNSKYFLASYGDLSSAKCKEGVIFFLTKILFKFYPSINLAFHCLNENFIEILFK